MRGRDFDLLTTTVNFISWRPSMDVPLHEELDAKQMRRVVYALALPIVGTQLLLRGVGIVDTAMVGHISAEAQAAVGMSQWIINLLLSLIQAVTIGGTVLVAKYTGSGDRDSRIIAADSAFWLGIFSAISMAAVGLAATRPLAEAMGADEELLRDVSSYMVILSLFFISRGVINVVSGIFQGFGDTKTPFWVIIGVNAIHLLIAFPLTFGMAGFPRLEIVGVALATGISETMGAALMIYIAYRKRLLSFKLPSTAMLKDTVFLGFPVFIERFSNTIMQMVYTRLVLFTSLEAYAAHSVGMVIESMSFLPGFGFAQAATTLVGQNLGARLPGKAKAYGNQALFIGLTVMGVLGLTFWVFPDLWMKLFSDDPGVIEYGILFCKFAAVLQIPMGLTMVLSGSLRGAGQTSWVMFASITGAWAVRIPFAYLFNGFFDQGIFYIWLAMPIDWTVRAFLMFLKYSSRRWSEKLA